MMIPQAKKLIYRKGQAVMLAVIFFLFISLTLLGAFGFLGVSHLQAANEALRSERAYVTSESGLEEVITRLLNLKQTNATQAVPEVITLNGGAANVYQTLS